MLTMYLCSIVVSVTYKNKKKRSKKLKLRPWAFKYLTVMQNAKR